MNHRELLVKYMVHIAKCEGIYFLPPGIKHFFSHEEFEELCRLSNEADKLYISTVAQR